MNKMIQSFGDLAAEEQSLAGGKGGTLARLFQAGYPVPGGFVILPAAFAGDDLTPEAWRQTKAQLATMREENGEEIAFAVRSSALSEDSALASFAGEFETVLDVRTDEAIRAAIHTVRRSRHSERVQAYTEAQGMDFAHEVAVVVQRLVEADISGVLFTADPVDGSYTHMVGNYVHGLGERLVAGEAEPYRFRLRRPRGQYDGPPELKRFARRLAKLASRLEMELGDPQDIEWAVAGRELFLLQSRPITTLQGHNPAIGDWNDSLRGDFLWTNVNAAEARPDVMSPFTWTLGEVLRRENQPMPGNYPFIGNVGGRVYVNVSLTLAMFRALGMNPQRMLPRMKMLFGPIPEGMEVPVFPLPLSTFFSIFPEMTKIRKKERAAPERIPGFLATNPDWCRTMQRRIEETQTQDELVALWREDLYPYWAESAFVVTGGMRPYMALSRKLQRRLTKLVGEADANALLSNLSSDTELMASLGPVVGVWKVSRGQMSREEYLERYGHRGPHEMELNAPRPAEDPGWLDRQLAEFNRAPVDVDALLARQRAAHEAAWQRLAERHPRRAEPVRRQLAKIPPAARLREAVRSEAVRLYGIVRAWALRAGELTGLGEDVFFLTYGELFDVLSGDETAVELIPARKETYERYRALPPYPTIIRGRFDPFKWATDPDRRNDIFDAHAPVPAPTSDTISGFAGAAGRVEGLVRRLDGPDEGALLQPGEILVAVTTNVGWTPLFPRAAAIVTDVGAPLSHAAIVARELGIPAVVGCVDATTRLRTGDRVRVDGGQGTVEILETAAS
jgi:phosphohistidine swiveling domain-containing protein